MLWGKFVWTSIHVVALGFPEVPDDKVREDYKEFFRSIGSVLPCPKCRVGYAINWEENPIDFFLYDRKSLFAWTVKIHNAVNKKTGRKEWTNEKAWEYYSKGEYAKGKGKETNAKKWASIILTLNILLLLVLLYAAARVFFRQKR